MHEIKSTRTRAGSRPPASERLITRYAQGFLPEHITPKVVEDRVRFILGHWALHSGQALGVFVPGERGLIFHEGNEAELGPVMGNGSIRELLDHLDPNDVEEIAALHLAFHGALELHASIADKDTVDLLLDHRMRLNDGRYHRVARQVIPLFWDETGRLVATLHLRRDTTGMKGLHEPVGWTLRAPDSVRDAFNELLAQEQGLPWRPSKREREVLYLLSKGMNSPEIAERLHISVHTVHNHRRRMLQASGAKSTVDLLLMARHWDMLA